MYPKSPKVNKDLVCHHIKHMMVLTTDNSSLICCTTMAWYSKSFFFFFIVMTIWQDLTLSGLINQAKEINNQSPWVHESDRWTVGYWYLNYKRDHAMTRSMHVIEDPCRHDPCPGVRQRKLWLWVLRWCSHPPAWFYVHQN